MSNPVSKGRFVYYITDRNSAARLNGNTYTLLQKQAGRRGEHIYRVDWDTAKITKLFEWLEDKWQKIAGVKHG